MVIAILRVLITLLISTQEPPSANLQSSAPEHWAWILDLGRQTRLAQTQRCPSGDMTFVHEGGHLHDLLQRMQSLCTDQWR